MGCGSSRSLKDQKLLLIKKNSEVEIDRAEAEDQTAPKNNNNHCKDQTTTEITTASYSKTDISKELPDVTNITAKSPNDLEIKRLGALVQNDLQRQQIRKVSDEKPARCTNLSTNQEESSQKSDEVKQKKMSEDPNSNHEASQPTDLPAAEFVQDSEDPRLETFITNGKNLLEQLNDMPMTMDDMPTNYQTAKAFRQLYYKARFDISKSFCRKFLNKMLEKGLIPCFVNAFQKIQRQWPHVFNELAYQDEAFKELPLSLKPSEYDPPEKAVANLWLKLNSSALGFTDWHETCRVHAGSQGLVEYFLQECLPAVSKQEKPIEEKTMQGALLKASLSTIYNCSMSTDNFTYFEKFNGVEKLLALTNTPSERLNMTALFALAYLIDEKNNHLIASKDETIDKILSFINHANKMKNRRYLGLSNVELANALRRIAVNDSNKKKIGSRKGLEALMKMFTAAKSDEQRVAAANAIWMLLFCDDNKILFKEIEGAADDIYKCINSENEELKQAAAGILWELKMKYEMKEHAASVADLREDEGNEFNHLMISYNWEQQPIMLKIRDSLKQQGYKVWMDVDKIGGSTLQAMATAVENSAAILIAVSRKYKESPNCRSEAEYAFQLKKDVIPLMLETNYRPDGWLGFIVGAKFWIDFASKVPFNEAVNKLTKEIGERGKIGSELIKAIDEMDLGAAPTQKPVSKTKDILKWSNKDVIGWLKEQEIAETAIKKSVLDKLTGKKLVSLENLRHQSPDFFFNVIRADFGFPDILDLLQFTDALQALIVG